MKSVIANKSLGILLIEDQAKINRNYLIIFYVIQLILFTNHLVKIIEKERSFTLKLFLLIFFFLIILVSIIYQLKKDVSNQLSKDTIRDYEFKPKRFDSCGQLIIHLNNGRKRIIIIDNGLQLEDFIKEIESLDIPQKKKNEKNSNR